MIQNSIKNPSDCRRAIHGEGYGYNEVEEVIKELFGK